MIFSCAVSFESKKKKIPDLSLPPCILVQLCTAHGAQINFGDLTPYFTHSWAKSCKMEDPRFRIWNIFKEVHASGCRLYWFNPLSTSILLSYLLVFLLSAEQVEPARAHWGGGWSSKRGRENKHSFNTFYFSSLSRKICIFKSTLTTTGKKLCMMTIPFIMIPEHNKCFEYLLHKFYS